MMSVWFYCKHHLTFQLEDALVGWAAGKAFSGSTDWVCRGQGERVISAFKILNINEKSKAKCGLVYDSKRVFWLQIHFSDEPRLIWHPGCP